MIGGEGEGRIEEEVGLEEVGDAGLGTCSEEEEFAVVVREGLELGN